MKISTYSDTNLSVLVLVVYSNNNNNNNNNEIPVHPKKSRDNDLSLCLK